MSQRLNEGDDVSKATATRSKSGTQPLKLEPRQEELISKLREALAGRDCARALSLLVHELVIAPLTEELPISDPDTDRTIGYLVPAERRYTLLTAAEYRGMQEDAKALSLAESGFASQTY
jgi:hypothetical protein